MENIITRVLSMLLIVALGAFLRRRHVFGEQDFHSLSAVLINIVLPCLVINNFAGFRFDASMLWLAAIGLVCTGLLAASGFLVGRRNGDAVLYLLNYAGFNIGCFTLPFIHSFMGSGAVVASCLFDVGNALLVCGGTYAIACLLQNGRQPHLTRFFLRKLLSSPPLLAYLVMIPLNFLPVRLPELVLSIAEIVSGGSTFITMLLLGIGLQTDRFRQYAAFIRRAACVRWLLVAGMVLIAYLLLPFPLEVRQTLTLCLCSPVSLSCIAYTDMAGSDVPNACAWNSVSILMSFPLVTVVLLLLLR